MRSRCSEMKQALLQWPKYSEPQMNQFHSTSFLIFSQKQALHLWDNSSDPSFINWSFSHWPSWESKVSWKVYRSFYLPHHHRLFTRTGQLQRDLCPSRPPGTFKIIWPKSDCTTNLSTDYHKLINYEAMMCPNGLIIAFSPTAHIGPSGSRRVSRRSCSRCDAVWHASVWSSWRVYEMLVCNVNPANDKWLIWLSDITPLKRGLRWDRKSVV